MCLSFRFIQLTQTKKKDETTAWRSFHNITNVIFFIRHTDNANIITKIQKVDTCIYNTAGNTVQYNWCTSQCTLNVLKWLAGVNSQLHDLLIVQMLPFHYLIHYLYKIDPSVKEGSNKFL